MTRILIRPLLFLILLLWDSSESLAITNDTIVNGCPLVKIDVERLPDLNIPRASHNILNVNGEVVVFGGHTTNFIPTATAEYYKNGKWHLMQMAFEHDNGFALKLTSGKVLIGGGHEKHMGIGQAWGAELYDPTTRSFEGIASLDKKRALASAVEIDSGRVIISGNWYGDDAIELFDGHHTFSYVKDVTSERATPFILRSAKDNAIIFGNNDIKGNPIDTAIVDDLLGKPRHVTLLEDWKTTSRFLPYDLSASFIGDEQTEDFSYLLALSNNRDSSESGHDSIVIVLVHNGGFSLLHTKCPVPTKSEWGKINYNFHIIADRQNKRAYLTGFNGEWTPGKHKPSRLFVLTIDYNVIPANLTLGYTEPFADYDICYPVLTDNGNLMLVGGLYERNNFKPLATTWLIHVNNSTVTTSQFKHWTWTIGGLIIITLVIVFFFLWKRYKRNSQLSDTCQKLDTPEILVSEETVQENTINTELIHRICQLMEDEKLFRNSDLKMTDLATILGINRNTISKCINQMKGCSFTQFVNTYRIDYAKEMMMTHPEMKMIEIYVAAGFANETSFFRNFRIITGMTPTEWKSKLSSEQ